MSRFASMEPLVEVCRMDPPKNCQLLICNDKCIRSNRNFKLAVQNRTRKVGAWFGSGWHSADKFGQVAVLGNLTEKSWNANAARFARISDCKAVNVVELCQAFRGYASSANPLVRRRSIRIL